jgi:hypothetical protein
MAIRWQQDDWYENAKTVPFALRSVEFHSSEELICKFDFVG